MHNVCPTMLQVYDAAYEKDHGHNSEDDDDSFTKMKTKKMATMMQMSLRIRTLSSTPVAFSAC